MDTEKLISIAAKLALLAVSTSQLPRVLEPARQYNRE